MEAALNWRDDPHWQLVEWNPALLTEKPPDRPVPLAERGNPDLWASLYIGNRLAATWFRRQPVTPPDAPSKLTRQPTGTKRGS